MKIILLTLIVLHSTVSSILSQPYYKPWAYDLKYIFKQKNSYLSPVWSHNGKHISFADRETLYIYDIIAKQYNVKKCLPNIGGLWWAPGDDRILIQKSNCVYSIYNLKTKKYCKISFPDSENARISYDLLHWYEDGRLLFAKDTYNGKNAFTQYDLSTNTVSEVSFMGLDSQYVSYAMSSDGSYLLGEKKLPRSSTDIILYDIGKKSSSVLHTGQFEYFQWCPDSKSYLISTARAETLLLWTTNTDTQCDTQGWIGKHYGFSMSPNGEYIASCSSINSFPGNNLYEGYGGLKVIDRKSGYQIEIVWLGYHARWSPSGRYIVVSTTDGIGIVDWGQFTKKYKTRSD